MHTFHKHFQNPVVLDSLSNEQVVDEFVLQSLVKSSGFVDV